MCPPFTIVNVVVSAYTSEPLPISKIVNTLPYCIYEPDTFSGIVYRRLVPKATIIMFHTGRIVSVGTKSKNLAFQSLSSTALELSNIIKKQISLNKIKVENIVVTSNLGKNIDLKKLILNSKRVYIPKKFPGCVFVNKARIKTLVFKSGKMIIAGAKSENQAKLALIDTTKQIKILDCISK